MYLHVYGLEKEGRGEVVKFLKLVINCELACFFFGLLGLTCLTFFHRYFLGCSKSALLGAH